MINRLWIVCRYHPIKSESFCIATSNGKLYSGAPRPQAFDAWLEKHASCGGNHDHFSLSYENTQDWRLDTIDDISSAVNELLA